MNADYQDARDRLATDLRIDRITRSRRQARQLADTILASTAFKFAVQDEARALLRRDPIDSTWPERPITEDE